MTMTNDEIAAARVHFELPESIEDSDIVANVEGSLWLVFTRRNAAVAMFKAALADLFHLKTREVGK